MEQSIRNSRRELNGIVTSDKMQKTITVKVATKKYHSVFKKGFIKHKKYYAHDELQEAKIGDKVLIVETRPLSSTKRWRLVRITERAK